VGGSHPNRFERFTASTALSGSTFFKPPALPEVADCGLPQFSVPIIFRPLPLLAPFLSRRVCDAYHKKLDVSSAYIQLFWGHVLSLSACVWHNVSPT